MVNKQLINLWCSLYIQDYNKEYLIIKGDVVNYTSNLTIKPDTKVFKVRFTHIYGDFIIEYIDNVDVLILPKYVHGNVLINNINSVHTLEMPVVDKNIVMLEAYKLKQITNKICCNNLTILGSVLSHIQIKTVNSIIIHSTNLQEIDISMCSGNINLSKNNLQKVILPENIFGEVNLSENFIESISDISSCDIYGKLDISHNLFDLRKNPFDLLSCLKQHDIYCAAGGEICF